MADVAIRDQAPPVLDATGLSPWQVLAAFRRSRVLIVSCGLLVGIGAYAFTVASVPRRYSASATISLELQRGAITLLQGAENGDPLPDPLPQVRSEVQVLTSRALLQQVADQLHLYADPEFNATLQPRPLGDRVKRAIAARLPDWALDPLARHGLLPDVREPDGAVPEGVVRELVIGAIARELGVINDGRSLIIGVQFNATDPQRAADVANAVVRAYVANRASSRAEANADANSELSQRMRDQRAEIEELEAKIAQTRERFNLVQTRAGSVGQQQLEDLGAALTRASADRAQAVANYDRAQILARGGGVPSGDAAVLGSGTISTLREREAAADRRVAQLATTLGPNHPQLVAARAELGTVRAAITAEAQRVMVSLGAQAAAAKAREADLKAQLEASQRSAGNLAVVQTQLQQLEKDVDSRRAIYQTLLQGAAQTAARRVASESTGVRVVSEAVAPAFPVSPRPKIAGLLGLGCGLALGGMISLVRAGGGRLDTQGDIRRATGIAPLAELAAQRRGVTASRAVVADPAGVTAEALRSLRTRLRFAGRTATPRSVVFVPGPGLASAADTAAAFARVAALDGIRTLLVDADLATPRLGSLVGMPVAAGLGEALRGQDHWRDHVMHDGTTGLDCLLSARPVAGGNAMLESMPMHNLVAELREDYNLLVMAAPPVDTVTQTLALASMAEAVVLVIGPRRARWQQAREAIAALRNAGRQTPALVMDRAA